MERITYRKTLDVHKNGIQFMLQGFQTADKISRVIEISLMASGDAIDFPLESITAVMYVTTPGTEKTSVNECTIKDNKVVYDVLPIVEEGITTMQLKIIETSPEGATSVLASPKFAVEVSASDTNEEDAEQSVTFTALEDAIAKAKATYDKGCIGISLDSECIFYAHYNDGTYYETDILKKLFLNGNVELSKSYAMGGTGVRAGEDTDNSKYYSNVSKSESLNAKAIMENSEDILEEVRTHGVYTAFRVNFESGEVEYVSPSFKFNINSESGELEADRQSDNFENEISRVVLDWLEYKEIDINKLQHHSSQIKTLQETNEEYGGRLANLEDSVRPIELGGTGASTVEEARENLEVLKVITNTYTGDGEETRFIDLGVTPKVVIVSSLSNGFYSDTLTGPFGGMATNVGSFKANGTVVEIVENGFNVGYKLDTDGLNLDALSNRRNEIYTYIAFV